MNGRNQPAKPIKHDQHSLSFQLLISPFWRKKGPLDRLIKNATGTGGLPRVERIIRYGTRIIPAQPRKEIGSQIQTDIE